MTCNAFSGTRIAVPTQQMHNLRSEPATNRAATSSLTECAAWRGGALILAFWDLDNLMQIGAVLVLAGFIPVRVARPDQSAAS